MSHKDGVTKMSHEDGVTKVKKLGHTWKIFRREELK